MRISSVDRDNSLAELEQILADYMRENDPKSTQADLEVYRLIRNIRIPLYVGAIVACLVFPVYFVFPQLIPICILTQAAILLAGYLVAVRVKSEYHVDLVDQIFSGKYWLLWSCYVYSHDIWHDYQEKLEILPANDMIELTSFRHIVRNKQVAVSMRLAL